MRILTRRGLFGLLFGWAAARKLPAADGEPTRITVEEIARIFAVPPHMIGPSDIVTGTIVPMRYFVGKHYCFNAPPHMISPGDIIAGTLYCNGIKITPVTTIDFANNPTKPVLIGPNGWVP